MVVNRFATTAAGVVAGVALAGTPSAVVALAGPSSAGVSPARRGECGALSVHASMPAPPTGLAVRQVVTLDASCTLRTGPAEFVTAERPAARPSAPAGGHVRSFSEMYDCCRILLSALYSDTVWSATAVESTPSTDMNTTHLGGGWTLETLNSTGGCATACAAAEYRHRAEFGYQGIFDPTGLWYHNRHDSTVIVRADGTATCEHSVALRHTFIGWNWVRGCGPAGPWR